MKKSKKWEKKIEFLIAKMGVTRYKKDAVIHLLRGGSLYTVRTKGSKKWTRYIDETNIYAEYLNAVGIKFEVGNDAPRGGKCGTFIFINELSSITKSYNYHQIIDKKKTKRRVETTCDFFGIENYSINDNLSINVNGDVDLQSRSLTQLPLNFKIVNGSFNCNLNALSTLEGSPEEVLGNFYCSMNKLTDLNGSPMIIGGDFQFYFNPIRDLRVFPAQITGEIFSSFKREEIQQA